MGRRHTRRWWAILSGAVWLANVLLVTALPFVLPVKRRLADLLAWIATLGPWAPALVIAAFVPVTLLFLPPAILAIGAGLIFGLWRGFLVAMAGKMLGGATAFLIARTLARERIARLVANDPYLRAVDRAVGREGFKIVALSRLSPLLPFGIMNFTFGATRIGFFSYLAASTLGGIPMTLLFAYMGSVARSFAEIASEGGAPVGLRRVLIVVGLALTAALAWWIARVAKRALERAGAHGELGP
jgi:uncharacterized membrane protein YdjX (TVP38/TMEM64 family)